MAKPALDAIQAGDWLCEPSDSRSYEFVSTDAVPGSPEKLAILARRIQQGLPLWHPNDRHSLDPPADAEAFYDNLDAEA